MLIGLPLSDPTILHFDEVDHQVAIGKVLVDGPLPYGQSEEPVMPLIRL